MAAISRALSSICRCKRSRYEGEAKYQQEYDQKERAYLLDEERHVQVLVQELEAKAVLHGRPCAVRLACPSLILVQQDLDIGAVDLPLGLAVCKVPLHQTPCVR